MNTNNKKAIELLHELRASVFEVTNSDLSRVIDLLQDNEDTEVQKKQKFRLGKDYDLTEDLKKASTLNKPSSKVEKIKILEGILAAEEGAMVYRKADGQEMMVTGLAVTFIDKYGNRKEDVVRFIEVAGKAQSKSNNKEQ